MNSFDRERLRIQRTKMLYPPGTRIVLGEMSDPYAPVPPGTRGTVNFVDDMGTIYPQWDNGRTLGLIFGEDSFRKLTPEELEEESVKIQAKTKRKSSQDCIAICSDLICTMLLFSAFIPITARLQRA